MSRRAHDPAVIDADSVSDAELTTAASSLRTAIAAAWARGWLPEDVHQVARRAASDLLASLAAVAIADQFAEQSTASTHPRWLDQFQQIGAVRWWEPTLPVLTQWAARHRIDRAGALRAALELLAVLRSLPELPVILPPPGSAQPLGDDQARHVDPRMLARVRALLSKAESTSFAEEAEALSAKAQELMSRYAIERAALDGADEAATPIAAARRLWLDAPYLEAKSLLVLEVAAANRCRGVMAKLGFVTVLGDALDLEIVELLTTSLLVQATSAMLVAGPQTNGRGQSRTRSYRHAFLLAYAARIGERLRARSAETMSAASAALVPVFAERERAVDELFGTLFPRTITRAFSLSNAAGWSAGRAAADAATIQAPRREVSGC